MEGDDAVAYALVPPPNFATVAPGIYRSGFPGPVNFGYLETLNLRSIVCLCPEPYPETNAEFIESHSIRLFQFGIPGKKEASVMIPADAVMGGLQVLLDVRNHPVLIHCNQGKHRTGRVVGCLRKLQSWCLPCVIEEYQRLADTKIRIPDITFITEFDVSCMAQSVLGVIYRFFGNGSQVKRLVYKQGL